MFSLMTVGYTNRVFSLFDLDLLDLDGYVDLGHVLAQMSFVESMVTHSSHISYKVGMTDLLGESSEG